MMHEEKFKELEELAKPLVAYLRKNYNPHATIIISHDFAKIAQDSLVVPFPVED